MSEKETHELKDRRSLLKGLVAGSALITGSKALPERWAKPLTNAVILPSHAQTTGDFNYGDFEYNDGYSNNYDGYNYDPGDQPDPGNNDENRDYSGGDYRYYTGSGDGRT